MARQPDVEITCVHCGVKFLTPYRRRNRSKYCSHPCYLSSLEKGPKLEISCLQCGKVFIIHHCYRNRTIFCRRQCYIEYWTATDVGRETELSAKAVSEFLAYDRDTGAITWKKQPHQGIAIGTFAGQPRKDGYLQISFRGRKILSHRIAWVIETGQWPSMEIDHINRVRHDNRFKNLRDVSHSENIRNSFRRTGKRT